ncbi:hypothetical protein EXIGLDRAFT_716780 [Exidia glandulosa HHB12029]|uniref:Uncharacterized protein n=1 Tax=Exidia glandulosa HHB12029 TaxID=1314781 RepID=A0A165IS52_EXIGL|nr:hypothetical protein EXIGLDRAFT_716780 [Exidia glandulosa HHB12029]
MMQTHASRIRSLSFEILYGCDLWLRILSLLPDDMPLLADLEVSLHMEDPNRIHDIGILRQHSGLWTPYAALQSLVFSGLHDVEYPADKSYSITSFTISDVTISRSDLARYFDLFPNLVDLRLYDCHHDISSSEPLPNQLQELHFCVRGDDFWDDFQPEALGTALFRVDPEHVPLVTFTSSCVDAMRFAALFSTMAPPTEITIDLARHTDVAGRLPGYLVGVVEAVAVNDEAQGRRYIVPHWGPKSPSAWAGVFHQCELHAVTRMTVTHYVWGLIGRLNARLPSLQILEVTFISKAEWAAEYLFLGKSDVDTGDRCHHSFVKRMQPPCALPSLRLIRLAPCAAAFRPCSVHVTTVLDIIGSLSSGRSILPDLEVKGLALVEDEGATVTSIRNVVAQLSYS